MQELILFTVKAQMHQELNNIFGITTIQNKLLNKMIWHLKTAEADTPREADIGMEHSCSMRKCSIGVNL